jgi:hypothetical protein
VHIALDSGFESYGVFMFSTLLRRTCQPYPNVEESATICPNLLKTVRICQNLSRLLKTSRICQKLSKATENCHSLPKSTRSQIASESLECHLEHGFSNNVKGYMWSRRQGSCSSFILPQKDFGRSLLFCVVIKQPLLV